MRRLPRPPRCGLADVLTEEWLQSNMASKHPSRAGRPTLATLVISFSKSRNPSASVSACKGIQNTDFSGTGAKHRWLRYQVASHDTHDELRRDLSSLLRGLKHFHNFNSRNHFVASVLHALVLVRSRQLNQAVSMGRHPEPGFQAVAPTVLPVKDRNHFSQLCSVLRVRSWRQNSSRAGPFPCESSGKREVPSTPVVRWSFAGRFGGIRVVVAAAAIGHGTRRNGKKSRRQSTDCCVALSAVRHFCFASRVWWWLCSPRGRQGSARHADPRSDYFVFAFHLSRTRTTTGAQSRQEVNSGNEPHPRHKSQRKKNRNHFTHAVPLDAFGPLQQLCPACFHRNSVEQLVSPCGGSLRAPPPPPHPN